jgi:hypothetical protein
VSEVTVSPKTSLYIASNCQRITSSREGRLSPDAGLVSGSLTGKLTMIFAKLFGIRPEDADDPPSHPPAAVEARRPRADEATGTHAALATGARPAQPKTRPEADAKPAATGFDPYNSGAFKKNNAWERINRR